MRQIFLLDKTSGSKCTNWTLCIKWKPKYAADKLFNLQREGLPLDQWQPMTENSNPKDKQVVFTLHIKFTLKTVFWWIRKHWKEFDTLIWHSLKTFHVNFRVKHNSTSLKCAVTNNGTSQNENRFYCLVDISVHTLLHKITYT